MYFLKGSNNFKDKALRVLSMLLVICIIFTSVKIPAFKSIFADSATSSDAEFEGELPDGLVINDEEGSGEHFDESDVLLYADREVTAGTELMPDEDILTEEQIQNATLSDATRTNGVVFKYFINDAGEAIIAGLSDDETATDIIIPNEIDGAPVKAIAQNAFYFKNLGSITFEENATIEKIGRFAFAGNNLTELELPESLKEVHKSAFRDNALSTVDLKNVEKVGATAFASNGITTLNMGTALTTVDHEAFRENNLTAVDFPNTLVTVGEDILSYNNKFVIARSNNDPLTVPAIQKTEGGHGYVINPITIRVSYIDVETGAALLDDVVVGDDLTSDNNIFALGAEQTYIPPTVQGYAPVLSENSNGIVFTPDTDNYHLTVNYRKVNEGLSLTKNPAVSTMIPPNTADIENLLRSLVIATNAAGEDLSERVEISPSSIDTTTEGATYEINYVLRGNNGEVERLTVPVYIGTDMNNFPIGNNWVLGDFTYSGESVTGFSAQGLAKVQTNKDLVIPHLNPVTRETITTVRDSGRSEVGTSIGAWFRNRGLTSVRDYNGNIKTINNEAFRNNPTLTQATFPNVESIRYYSFYQTGLTDFDFSKVKMIGDGAFRETKIKNVIAPELETLDGYAFYNVQTLGTDPDYPQGIYLPKLNILKNSTFGYTRITYLNETQIPNVTTLEGWVFNNSAIENVDLPKVTEIGNATFSTQKNRALSSINMPNLITAGDSAFSNNSLTEVSLPRLTRTGNATFNANKIATIDLPLLEVIGNAAFDNNSLETVHGMPLLREMGQRAFVYNKIKEIYLPSIQKIGPYAFWHDYGNTEYNANRRNPGLSVYGGFIPLYTDSTNIESKENYIVNPTETETGEFTEADFTWDTTDPGKVTGFTSQGKAKLIARDYNLVLPARATKVGSYAFNGSNVKTVLGVNVVEVENNAFENNPINRVDFPEVTTIGNSAFYNNTGGSDRLKTINLDKLTTIGRNAFHNAGLEGTLSLPRLVNISDNAFYQNSITRVLAPVATTIGASAFQSNNIEEITRDQFPVVEQIGNSAFYYQQSAIKKIDLPTVQKLYTSSTYYNDNRRGKTIQNIVLPQGMVLSGSLNSAFNYYQPTTNAYYYGMQRPGAIILTNEPNADGTLDRTNPDNIREVINNIDANLTSNTGWKGKRTGFEARTYVVNPSTVKVNYRLDTGESLDGMDGRPSVADYREYIYEELEPDNRQHIVDPSKTDGRYILKLASSGRTYTAPSIAGYALLKVVKADGTETRDRSILVPYEEEGQRTDREITFVYKKLSEANISDVKLSYFVSDGSGTSLGQEREYTQNGSSSQLPQMLTSFNIEEIKKTIRNGKIRVNFDTDYIDLNSIILSHSDQSSPFFPNDALTVYPGGLEIKLKPNIAPGDAIRGVKIQYRYKSPDTPDGTATNFRMTIVDEDSNGDEELIGVAENVKLSLVYQPKPSITANMSLNIPGYNYLGYTEASNGPRNLGTLEQITDGYKVIENPANATFRYTVGNIYYNVDGVKLTTKIPTYTAIENGVEVTRSAIFDPAANPDWTLADDGVTLTSTKRFTATRDADSINRKLPKLNLKFPNLKEKSEVVNEIYADIIPARYDNDPSTATVSAIGDLGIGDSLIVYPLYTPPLEPWIPGDTGVGKTHANAPRVLNNYAYMYDSSEDRAKEVPYNVYFSSTNEITDIMNASIIDYDLDERLYYTGIRFNQTASQAGDMSVTVTAYKKNGTKINPNADRVVFEQQSVIDTANSINFGSVTDIDYVQIKLNETDVTPLSKGLSFRVITKVKDPDNFLLDNGASDLLVNNALFIADRYKKGTDTPVSTRPDDEKYEFINGNYIIDDPAQVQILPYKAYLGVNKSLVHSKNPTGYKMFPSYESGEYVLEGQEGYWHITLDSYIEGNRNTRANEVIENLEIIDVLPEAIAVSRSDVKLDPLFIRTGGRFEFIEDYPVTENGVTELRTAIKFTAARFNIKSYGNEALRIASINSKYTARTIKNKLTNKVYAKWSNDNVVMSNPAHGASNTEYVNPDGSATTEADKWAYAEQSIRNANMSALTARLEIRNRQDMLWQESTPTGSLEPFDYRMTIRNLTQTEGEIDYAGIDMINVFPSVGDLILNGTNKPRNSEFSNKLDLSRIGDMVIPAGYTVSYLNSDTEVHDMIATGPWQNMDDIGNDASLWSTTPQANAKAIRVTATPGITLSKGAVLRIDVPMIAPDLTGTTGDLIDKKAIDSFVFRYYEVGTTNYRKYQEPNSVYNYMSVPKGSIKFIKYGKLGNQSADSTATPLEGALFEIALTSATSTPLAVASSNENGEVVFEDLAIDKSYRIREITAPDGYTLSSRSFDVGPQRFNASGEANNYLVTLTESQSKTFMNVKPLKANLKINKYTKDGATPLANISFRIRGLDATNNTIDTTLYTDANGEIALTDLPEGRYQVSEIASTAINRYEPARDQNFTINAANNGTEINLRFINNKFQVLMQKVIVNNEADLDPANWDQLTDFGKRKVSGYKFKVTGDDGTSFTTANTNGNGQVILRGLTTGVIYTVTEEANQTSNLRNLYTHNQREYKFYITDDGKLMNAANNVRFKQYALNFPNIPKEIRGNITVEKVDNSTPENQLEGAVFKISKLELTSTGQVASVTDLNRNMTTALDAGGKATVTFDNLIPGTYRIEEITPPLGYVLNTTPIEVIIPSAVTDSLLTDANYNVTGENISYSVSRKLVNTPIKVAGIKGSEIDGYKNVPHAVADRYLADNIGGNPNLKVRRTGSASSTVYEALAGIKFNLFIKENGVLSANPEVINGSTDIITDADGNINFHDYVFDFNKTYVLKETETIRGYELNTTEFEFSPAVYASRPGFNGKIDFFIHNNKESGRISISKYDSYTKENLAGAKFALYKATKAELLANPAMQPVEVVETNESGYAIFDKLLYGTYVVREIETPDTDAYHYIGLREDMEVTVSAARKVINKSVLNTRVIDIPVRKIWSGGSEASVRVGLYRSTDIHEIGTLIEEKTLRANVDENLNFKDSFTDKPLTDSIGTIYYYTVKEIDVDENLYTSVVTGNVQTGFTITNTATNENKTAIGVTKNWNLSNISIPEGTSVRAVLYRVNSGDRLTSTDVTRIDDVILNADNNWQHTFTNLQRRELGNEIVYRVDEEATPSGFDSVRALAPGNNNSFILTNTNVRRGQITVTKNWVGIDASSAPDVRVELINADTNEVIQAGNLTENAGVIGITFRDVPSYYYTLVNGNLSATPIKYKLVEKYVNADGSLSESRSGYTSISSLTDATFADYSSAGNIRNDINATLTNTMEKVDITATKTWSGVDANEAPDVRVRLYDMTADTSADKSNTSTHIAIGGEITLNTANGWSHTYADLPKYKPDGSTLIDYRLVEVTSFNGYTSSIIKNTTPKTENADEAISFKVINERVTTQVNLIKTWNVKESLYDGYDMNYPEVTLHLFADITNDGNRNGSEVLPSVNGAPVNAIKLNAGNNFNVTYTGLSKYAPDGVTEIVYYAREEAITGFTSANSEINLVANESGILSATFENTQDDMSFRVTKRWDNIGGYTAEEIANIPRVEVALYATINGQRHLVTGRNATLEKVNANDATVWEATFENLPTHTLAGAQISYDAVELGTDTRPGYIANVTNSADEAEIVNTALTKNIVLKKQWERIENALVNTGFAEFYLLKNGVRTTTAPIVLTEDSRFYNGEAWTYVFENLPIYDITGTTVINYSIEEVDIPGFEITTLNDVNHTNNDGRLIQTDKEFINTYNTVDINVEKQWVGVDPANAPSINLRLVDVTADTSADRSNPNAWLTIEDFTLSNADNWEKTFENLPKFKADGTTEIVYDVIEVSNLPGYTLTKSSETAQFEGDEDADINFTLTNERVRRNITLSKSFETAENIFRNGDEFRTTPEVNLHVYADYTDNNVDDKVEITTTLNADGIKLNSANGYRITYENLPKYADDGVTEIVYSASEDAITGFRADADTLTLATLSNASDDIAAEFVNRQILDELIVTKVWEGLDRYTSEELASLPAVEVELYAIIDGQRKLVTGRSAVLERNDISDPSVLTAVFRDLPKYTYDFRPISYEVIEKDVDRRPGYNVTYEVDANTSDTIITNTLKTRDIYVTKTWYTSALSGADTSRVNVYLTKNGVRTSSAPTTVTAADNAYNGVPFTYVFANLPYYEADGRTPIDYGVEEVPMPGFVTSISTRDEAVSGNPNKLDTKIFDIRNSFTTVDVEVEKRWENVDISLTPDVTMAIVKKEADGSSAIVAGTESLLNRANNYRVTYNGLPKFEADGITAIDYAVVETDERAGYEFSYEKTVTNNGDNISLVATNTRVNAKLVLEKTFKDDNSGYERPEVTFRLFADETNDGIENPIEISSADGIKLNRRNGFKTELTLPRYTIDGLTEISYYVSEDNIAGYKPIEGRVLLSTSSDASRGYTLSASIENELITRNIKAKKVWNNLDEYYNANISSLPEVHAVLVDATNPDREIEVATKALNAGNNYMAEFENYPKFKADGNTEIVYKVYELEARDAGFLGYTSNVSEATYDNEGNISYVIENSPRYRDIEISKKWWGIHAKEYIQIYLLRDGERTTATPITINADMDWKYRFDNEPYYRVNGREKIEYSIEELEIAGVEYSLKSNENGDTLEIEITNESASKPNTGGGGGGGSTGGGGRVPSGGGPGTVIEDTKELIETIKEEVSEAKDVNEALSNIAKVVKTGDYTNVFVYMILLLGSISMIIFLIVKRRKKDRE